MVANRWSSLGHPSARFAVYPKAIGTTAPTVRVEVKDTPESAPVDCGSLFNAVAYRCRHASCAAEVLLTGSAIMATKTSSGKQQDIAKLATPTDLGEAARKEVSAGLTKLLADVFALYVKTKNFHWHVSGPHFRDYHLLLDDQSALVFAMVDPIAERARKLGGTTLRSVGEIVSLKRLSDNDEAFVSPESMLSELRTDNESLVRYMRELHELCDDKDDVATASLLENWIDQTEERVWFLFETTRQPS